jgi:hypothetical protein
MPEKSWAMPQGKFHENFTTDSSVPQESCQKVNADIFAMIRLGRITVLSTYGMRSPWRSLIAIHSSMVSMRSLSAFLKGLSVGPHAFQARYMSIIRLFVINNLIFSSCQGCRDILREHITISLYPNGFNSQEWRGRSGKSPANRAVG